MTDLFDFTERVDVYAVMGNPVAHSKSPRIHSLFAQQTQQRIQYSAIQVDSGGFAQAVGNFDVNGGKGLNITLPFKREAWQLVDDRSPRAELAGVVNTIKFQDKQLYGDNTDGVGLINDLFTNHSMAIKHKQVLLMGAGGAARGVLAPLLEQQPTSLVIVNRTPDKAEFLAREFGGLGNLSACGYPDLQGQKFDLIINATAASLQKLLPPLPQGGIVEEGCCYDMMYGSQPTPFMQWATSQGATKILDGLGMLVEQAAESFYIWRGVRPKTDEVIKTLRAEMQS